MDKTSKITVSGIFIGALIFIGFYLSSLYDIHIIGIPSLEEFISMLGVLILIISGFFYFSLKTIKQ